MRLMTLNIWGGRVLEPLLTFLKQEAASTDFFCFQEVYSSEELIYTRGEVLPEGASVYELSQNNRARANVLSELEKSLEGFQGIFHSAQDKTDHLGFIEDDLQYGLASFFKKDVEVIGVGEEFVHGGRNSMLDQDYSTLPRNIQHVQISYKGSVLTIVNFHGLWNTNGKTDSPERIAQSQKVKEFLDSIEGHKILCGDFNLRPDTQSFAILEEGMRNLIKEFGVESTRSAIYKKPQKLADYILISPNIDIKHFEVIQNEVSDHLPVILEF